MPLLLKAWRSIRGRRKEHGADPRRVRAIPGAIPGSSLEFRVQKILSAHTSCSLQHLVAEIAEYLRQFEDPSVLGSLDEGLWGGWVWPTLAREALWRLEGNLLAIEAPSPQANDMAPPAQSGRGAPTAASCPAAW